MGLFSQTLVVVLILGAECCGQQLSEVNNVLFPAEHRDADRLDILEAESLDTLDKDSLETLDTGQPDEMSQHSFEVAGEPERCLKQFPRPETKYFYLNSITAMIRILTSQNPTQRLLTEVFRIFGSEVLGYSLGVTINSNHSTILDPNTQFSNISTCKMQFCGDMDAKPGQISVPSEMIALGVMLPPSYHVDSWNLVDMGQLGPAVSLAWFVPTRTAERVSPQVWDHWKTYTASENVKLIQLTEDEIQMIEKHLKDGDGRYFCRHGCTNGISTTKYCKNIRDNCAILVSDYPVESSLFTTASILRQIEGTGMRVLIAYVGTNIENVLDSLEISTQGSNSSYLLLSPHPSTYTIRYKYTQVKFPTCHDPLLMREKVDSTCIYSPHRLAKVAWMHLQNGAPSLYSFLESFSFTYSEFVDLLSLHNSMMAEDPGTSIRDIACQWLLHNAPVFLDGQDTIRPWYKKYTSKIESKQLLYIGGIFPITGKKYNAPDLAPVAQMAVRHINNNNTILPKHSLSLDVLDGQCEPGVVMKKFIDVVKTKDIERFRSTAGVLGPACSDTVEPLAGVAKHYRTVIITYSAEGSISNENSRDYPYFFRTIAENKMYKHAYIKMLNQLNWSKIAALTQDGQKYSDHISQMQDEFQNHGITFIQKREFPYETTDLQMYLRDLKDRKAKIIIGDFYEESARFVMCEAYKQGMTQADGYVWFLPGWFKENWFDTDHLRQRSKEGSRHSTPRNNGTDDLGEDSLFNEEIRYVDVLEEMGDTDFSTSDRVEGKGYLPDCTSHQMRSALDGHLTLVHSNYAPDDQLMQTNHTVADWKKDLELELEKSDEKYRASENITADPSGRLLDQARRIHYNRDSEPNKYSGYVYDAVWLYGLALDKLIQQNMSYIQDLHSKRTVKKFVEIIKTIDFQGVTGRINFFGRNSRLSEVEIKQWHDKDEDRDKPYTILIGVYEPPYSQSSDTGEDEKKEGTLRWNSAMLRWKTVDGKKPADHSKECGVLSGFATSLNIECQLAITVAFIIGFCFVLFIIVLLFFAFKRRYEMKMRAQEDRMRALGLMEPIKALALDEWEIPRDRVVINRKLGEGAFGTVYGGECFFDEKGWVAVAVKTLKVGSTNDIKIDFLSEAEMMKRFDHKNIVKLLGVCTRNEPVYTVMEYMLYGDLKTYLLARRHLVNERNREEMDEVSNRRLTSMALDIARGLAYLADLKYVHRDLACRNCLVNTSRTVKLADFGMTRAMFESDYYRFNRRGMLPVRWMSPESLADGLFTPSSDVWSYGVLLYEIITFGSFPFQGLSNNQVLEHVKSGNTLTVPSGIKPQLETLLRTCWRIEATKRPTAPEIVELLGNNPRLVSPCIDVPLASVAIERTDSLELIPNNRLPGSTNQSRKPINNNNARKGRESIAMSQLTVGGQLVLPGGLCPLNLSEDPGYGSGAYSPMHAPVTAGNVHNNGTLSEGLGLREPLLKDYVEPPSSYVPPGYIYLDNPKKKDYFSEGLASI